MKRLIIYFMILYMMICPCTSYAANIDEYLNGSAANVIEGDTTIDFYVRIAFDGRDIADRVIPNTQVTYGTAFIKGVKLMWEGTYQNKRVRVHIEQVNLDNEKEKVIVIFGAVNNRLDYSCASKSSDTVWMYTGDGRSFFTLIYTYKEFLYTAGHEIGHIWGAGDIYNDSNELVRTIKSPMNDRSTFYAQDVDYYFILHNRTWELSDPLSYSADETIMRYAEAE